MNVVAIIQARMSSSRLPGKVLKKLCGRSVLSHVIERARACERIDKVVIATTTETEDDIISDECKKEKVQVYRGCINNVLERYYQAAIQSKADVIVRITSDCPLLDPDVVCSMVELFERLNSSGQSVDYVGNPEKQTHPRGTEAEVFFFETLEKAYKHASEPYELEHVTPYIYHHKDEFNLRTFGNDVDQSGYRWTLDTPEDYEFISEIYQRLYKDGELIRSEQIIDLLQRFPELKRINSHVRQKQLGE